MRSQRYCSEDGFNYVYPESIRKIDTYGDYPALMNTIEKHYKRLVGLGVPKEDARFVLPNACDTVLVTSFNLRQLIHICNERLCSKAQWEIRQLVQEMVKLVDPELMFMLVPKCKSGRIICHTPCNKKEN
jgi:thymidylate synthase (FAD)